MVNVREHLALYLGIHLSLMFLMYPEMVIGSTNSGHWEIVLLYCTVQLLLLFLYSKSLRAFPGQDLIQIVSRLGKWPTRLLLFPYFLFLLASITLSARAHSEMLTMVLFKRTPLWALYAVILVLAFYIGHKGIRAIYRTAFLYFLMFFPLLAFVLISATTQMDWDYFFPAFDFSFDFVKRKAFYSGLYAFSPFLFLGMVNHLSQKRGRYHKLKWAGGLSLLVVSYLGAVYISLLVHGAETSQQLEYALLTALDAIDLEWFIFDRVTVLYVVSTVGFLLLYLAMQIWILEEVVTRVYWSIKPVYVGAGGTIACYILACLIPNWDIMLKSVYLDTPLRLYCMMGIPLLVFILARVQRKGGEHEEVTAKSA